MKRVLSIAVLLVLCLGLVWFVSTATSPDDSSTVADVDVEEEPTNTPKPVEPTNTPEPAPVYSEIRQNINTMTEAQWEAFAETLTDKSVTGWTGTVKDVDQTLGSYTVLVAVGNNDNQVSVPVGEDLALTFNKGDEVTFSGTVSSVTWILGLIDLRLKDATIE